MDGELHLVALADLQCTPDLVEAGYVAKEKDGRRDRYHIQAHLPLPVTVRLLQVRVEPGRGWLLQRR